MICGGAQLKDEVVKVLEAMEYRNYFIFS